MEAIFAQSRASSLYELEALCISNRYYYFAITKLPFKFQRPVIYSFYPTISPALFTGRKRVKLFYFRLVKT